MAVEKESVCVECLGKEHARHERMWGSGKKGGVMIIGDSPTLYEDERNHYYVGTASKFLIKELATVGINVEDCYVTKAIKCHHPASKPSKDTIKRCKELLEYEIDFVKPKWILTLGSLPFEMLCNKGLMKNRGKLIHYKDIPMIATINPSLVLNQPGHMSEFRADLNYFSRLIDGWEIPDDFNYKIIRTSLDVVEFLQALMATDAIAYDIEATSLDDTLPDSKIFMLGVATRKGCFIIPFEDDYKYLMNKLFSHYEYEKIAHNAKFDNRWLRNRGVVPQVTYDTYLAAYLLNVNIPHGLKYLAKTYLGAADYDAGIEFKADLSDAEWDAMAKYCALDCYYTLKLYDVTKKELQEDGKLWNVFKYIVMPGERVLQKIENYGAYVNPEELANVKTLYEAEREKVSAEIEEVLPAKWKGKINLNSPTQLGELLYEDLGLPIIARTPTGGYSTGRSTLLRLVDKHPLPSLILERRRFEKALNGFLTPWEEYLKRDGRLHTTYKIAHTATGRLSAENPNLQQVPRDKNVRSLVGAPKGRVFIEADYSQIELRVAAFIANAETMKNAYRRGEDIHTKTAASVSHVRPEDVTKSQRTAAKAINFGFLFGMWWKSFKSYAFDSYGVVVTDKEAEHARTKYFETYPELLDWHDRQRREVIQHRAIRTLTGRIRHLPDIDSPDKELRGSAERQAINTPVQSFASDMCLLAMILIDKNLELKYKGKAHLVGQVHDAIMVEANEDVGREVALMVKKCMESVPIVLEKYFNVKLDLPIVADVNMGSAWGKGEEVK